MHEAELVLHYPHPIAKAIEGALLPDAANETPKSRAEISRAGGELTVQIRADDLAALRAAVNSYLRWVDAAERAARVGR